MSRQQILGWLAVFVSVGLAILGFMVFVLGVLAEFLNTRNQTIGLNETFTPTSITGAFTPTIQLALAGLVLSGLMALFGFALVMVLLARQSRKLAPGYGDAYRFMERLQFDEAIPLLERAIESGRETLDVLALLTSAYAHTGQLAKAQSTADRAVHLFPEDPGSYMTLANGYQMQASYEEAARALQAAVALAPNQPVIWAELGFVQRLAGDEDAAIESFEQAALSRMPTMYSVRVYHHLAQAYKAAGDAEQAAAAMAKMMSARHGLNAWKPLQRAMEGTSYGQTLRYEIEEIQQSIMKADSASIR